MNALEIETYLADLGQALGNLSVQQPIRILMVGGAFMLTQVGSRPATKDIDILLQDMPDPTASSLYRPFQSAVQTVAARHGLPSNWINDVIGDALRNYGPPPQGTVWRVFGPLEVSVPNADYILALKILAGRPLDITDARVLCQKQGISTRAEARRILDTYITDPLIKQANAVGTTLALLFP